MPSAPGTVVRSTFGSRGRTLSWSHALEHARADAGLWTFAAGGLATALFLRLWDLNALGYNSDEAVYAGQAAALAHVSALTPYFPIFRAHPLLFQTIHSLGYRLGTGDPFGRVLAGSFGLGTVFLVFKLGDLLYGRRTGIIAAVFIALMPYDVLVSRQVLLDGPMTFFATLTLYLVARFAVSRKPVWLYAAGGAMGLTVLGKETSILIVGAAYAFFALSPDVGARARDLAIAAGVMALTIAPYPVALRLAGHSQSGQQYLAYQLFRRPNHNWTFYPATVPLAVGPLLVLSAALGLWLLHREISWRETLLLSWIAIPALFFQLYPVKGFQYLLPTAPAFAVLAARTLGRTGRRRLGLAAAVIVAVSLAIPAWQRIQPATSGTFLAGSGGVPGGRELGRWIGSHVPSGAEILAIGPSMANIVEFYGHRQTYGLSVGPNPLRRNPAYEPIPNPDLAIRTNEVQYLVWDAYTADRTPFFANKLLGYARRYNGRVVYSATIPIRSDGANSTRQLIVVYAVRR